jgi:hypothetical protein
MLRTLRRVSAHTDTRNAEDAAPTAGSARDVIIRRQETQYQRATSTRTKPLQPPPTNMTTQASNRLFV